MSDFYIKSGDMLPPLTAILSDADGPVSLAEVSALAFSMREVGGDVVIDNAQATPDPDQGANPGLVRYEWVSGDTDIAGLFVAEFKAVWDGGPQRFPNYTYLTVEIGERIA